MNNKDGRDFCELSTRSDGDPIKNKINKVKMTVNTIAGRSLVSLFDIKLIKNFLKLNRL